MKKEIKDDLIYSQMLRDEDIRDLTKLRLGICKKCVNKMTKEELLFLLNSRDEDGDVKNE